MQRWSTRHLPPARRFGYWREVLCEAFTALDSTTTESGQFDSDVWLRRFSDVSVSTVRSSSYTIRRGPREIRQDPAEHYFCDLQLSGTSVVRQNGRQAVVRPGEFFIVDTRHAYEASFLGNPGDAWKIVCLQIPRDRLATRLAAPEALTARRFDTWGGTAALAGHFIRGLTSMRNEPAPDEQLRLADILVDLLALAMSPATAAAVPGGAGITPHERDRSRVLLHIDSHLGDENLSAAGVASTFGISVRYLHRLFEGTHSSFAKLVSDKRLQRCAADLAVHGARVSDVAYRWGFRDLTHFGRMFRRQFGMSASQWQRERTKPAG